MQKFVVCALVGIGGYLIGFYECKYKMQKAILEGFIDKQSEEDEEIKQK